MNYYYIFTEYIISLNIAFGAILLRKDQNRINFSIIAINKSNLG